MRCSRLNRAASRLEKLRKTPAALNEQSKASDKAWQLDFVKGLGEQSKPVRDQLKQKAQWSSEAEQTQEPQREWLKMLRLWHMASALKIWSLR